MPLIHSQQWKLETFLLPINYLAGGAFKLALLKEGFIFNAITHNTYADIANSAWELQNAYGYGTGGQVMTALAPLRDDAGLNAYVPFNNITWFASGGNLVTQGALMYYAAPPLPPSQTVVGFIDFGTARTVVDGSPLTVGNIRLRKT